MNLGEMHWEVFPHPAYSPDLAPSDFHLFGRLKEAMKKKMFRDDHEVKLFLQRWLEEQPQTRFESRIRRCSSEGDGV